MLLLIPGVCCVVVGRAGLWVPVCVLVCITIKADRVEQTVQVGKSWRLSISPFLLAFWFSSMHREQYASMSRLSWTLVASTRAGLVSVAIFGAVNLFSRAI